jgi:hypothetical protein
MKRAIQNWYDGTYTAHENRDDSALYFAGGFYERHWTSRVAHAIAEFWGKHWQYAISTGIAVIGIFIALRKL